VVNNAATEAKVTLVGNRRVEDFWQYVETKNTETGETAREYVYYIVYAMPVAAWDNMFAHYAADVFGPLPEGRRQFPGAASGV
jgi:ribonucleotide monophosphatase NagD (HAD superfamily)